MMLANNHLDRYRTSLHPKFLQMIDDQIRASNAQESVRVIKENECKWISQGKREAYDDCITIAEIAIDGKDLADKLRRRKEQILG